MTQAPKRKLMLIFSASTLLALCVAIYGLKGYLLPMSLAIALVYLTRPLNYYLKQLGLSSNAAASVVSLSLFGIILLIIFQGIPVIAQEFSRFVQTLPSSIESSYRVLNTHLVDYGVQLQIPNWQAIIDRIIDQQDITSLNAIPKLLTNTIQHSIDIVLFFTGLLFIPLFFFFALKDGENAVHNFIDWTPARIRPEISWFVNSVHETLTIWISGQGSLLITLCILYTAGLTLINSPYSVTLGIMTGLLYIIPVAGVILALTVTMITMTATYGASTLIILQVLAVYGSIQLLESLILAPVMIGNRLGLNLPSALLVIMIGGGLFGAIGVVLAIPTASLLMKTLGNIFSESDDSWIFDQQ